MLNHIDNVLNSGEFISSDRGFSVTMTLTRREVKGGKNGNYKPGEKIWQELVKETRSIYEVKNKDQLCCGRAIVVVREYAKHKAGEPSCFENGRKNRGKKTQQLKLARELYKAAGMPEGPCGHAEIEQFRNYLGPKGYQVIVVDPVRGGVTFTWEAYYPANRGFSLVFLSVVLPFSLRFWLLAFCFGCFCAEEKTSADSRLGFLLSMREMKMRLPWNVCVTCR